MAIFTEFEKYIVELNKHLIEIKTKMSMPNDIVQICNSRFYLPNYPIDYIQNIIVTYQNYFEKPNLDIINAYLPDDAIILDIGANIGNHTLYWANERNAKKIHSFEPVKSTFDILSKNIEINNLPDRVFPHNVGMSNECTNASIRAFFGSNIGATRLTKSEHGAIKLVSVDSLNLDEERIDLIKIDTEGHEVQTLEGAVETINKYRPVIVIETFDYKTAVDTFMQKNNYSVAKVITEADFVYAPNEKK